MKFYLAIVAVLITGCITTTGQKVAQKREVMPICSQLVADFYASMDSKGMFMGAPMEAKNATIFPSIRKITRDKIDVLCLLSGNIPKERSGCVVLGDVVGKCSTGDGDVFLWYGYGSPDMGDDGDRG